jgi:hypothetical protein
MEKYSGFSGRIERATSSFASNFPGNCFNALKARGKADCFRCGTLFAPQQEERFS